MIDEETFKKFGLEVDSRMKQMRAGKSNLEMAEIFLSLTHLDMTPKEVISVWGESMVHYYTHSINFVPGAKEFLQKLKGMDYEMVIATATEEYLVKFALRHFDIDIFDSIHTESSIGLPKHKPKFFESLLQKIGRTAGEVFFFEDSVVSIKSATSIGIETCAVLHSLTKRHEKELRQSCVACIDDFRAEELEKVLAKLD